MSIGWYWANGIIHNILNPVYFLKPFTHQLHSNYISLTDPTKLYSDVMPFCVGKNNFEAKWYFKQCIILFFLAIWLGSQTAAIFCDRDIINCLYSLTVA